MKPERKSKPEVRGSTYVAAYLGTTPGSLHNWCRKPPVASKTLSDGTTCALVFPGSDLDALGLRGEISARVWYVESLPALREWFAAWKEMSPESAAEYWRVVDAQLKLLTQNQNKRGTKPQQSGWGN